MRDIEIKLPAKIDSPKKVFAAIGLVKDKVSQNLSYPAMIGSIVRSVPLNMLA